MTCRPCVAARLLVAVVAASVAASGEASRAAETLALPGDIAFVSSRDGGTGIYTMAADGRRQIRLTQPAPSGGEPSWSPDGRSIAFSTGEEVWTMRPDGSELKRINAGRSPAWSPDGKHLAVVSLSEKALVIASVAQRGSRTLVRAGANEQLSSPSWAPDGRQLTYVVKSSVSKPGRIETIHSNGKRRSVVAQISAFGSAFTGDPHWGPEDVIVFADFPSRGDGADLFTISLRTGKRQTLTRSSKVEETDPVWSPDGRTIAFVSDSFDDENESGISVMPAQGGKPRRVLADTEHSYGDPTWSPDGRRLAADTLNPDNSTSVVIIRAAGGEPTRLLGGETHRSPAWSPDAKTLAFVSDDYELSLLPPTSQPRHVKGAECWQTISWSPDGKRLACDTMDGIQILRVATGSSTTLFSDAGAGDEPGTDPAWSPDGTELAYAHGCTLEIYDFTNRVSRPIPMPRRVCPVQPAWSPDGKRLAAVIGGWIHTFAPDGTRSQRLAPGSNPEWSPDGRRIAFDHNRAGNRDVYTMSRDGSSVTRLTTAAGADSDPSWRPR